MTDLALVVSAAARAEQLGFGAAGSTTSLGLVADHDAGMLSSAVSPSELRPAGRVRARSSTPTPRTFPGPSGQSGRLGAHRAASNAAPSRPARRTPVCGLPRLWPGFPAQQAIRTAVTTAPSPGQSRS